MPNVLIAVTVFHVNLCYISTPRRDAAQWLERDNLTMSLTAVRFRTRLGAEYSENFHVSPPQCLDIVSMFCTWARHRDGNVCDAPKWLKGCMLYVELKWHTNDTVDKL